MLVVVDWRWIKDFLKLDFTVTALGISEAMCKYLAKKFKNLNIVCRNIEETKLPYKYDLVFDFRSFKYIINRK